MWLTQLCHGLDIAKRLHRSMILPTVKATRCDSKTLLCQVEKDVAIDMRLQRLRTLSTARCILLCSSTSWIQVEKGTAMLSCRHLHITFIAAACRSFCSASVLAQLPNAFADSLIINLFTMPNASPRNLCCKRICSNQLPKAQTTALADQRLNTLQLTRVSRTAHCQATQDSESRRRIQRIKTLAPDKAN